MACFRLWPYTGELHPSLFENGTNVGDSVMSVETKFQDHYTGFYKLPTTRTTNWVKSFGSFMSRLEDYNDALADVRGQILKRRNGTAWQDLVGGQGSIIAGNQPDFLEKLSNETGVTGVFLQWKDFNMPGHSWNSADDDANLLVGKFYPWVGSDKFCHYLTGDNFTRHRWDIVYDHVCTTNVSEAQNARSLELYFLNAVKIDEKYYWPSHAYPSNMYTDLPKYVFYVHIVQDGVATSEGNVYAGNTKIIPYGCKPQFKWTAPPQNYHNKPILDEVFVMSQFWGKAFFHKNIEILPRVAPYLHFLQQHTSVKIYISDPKKNTQSMLNFLGVPSSRIVKGTVRAKVLYLPQATNCGSANIQETQLLSFHLRRVILSTFPQLVNKQKSIVLIRRSGKRHFTQADQLKTLVEKLAREFDLNFYWFRDDPVPSLTDAMINFYQAVLIVAPHGAGLSNILFTPPGSYVIEGLCNPPHTNLCFMRLSHLLGHRYHALISSKGCERYLDIPAEDIAAAVKLYLQQMRRNGSI